MIRRSGRGVGRNARFRMRVISPNKVRIHLARSGMSMLRSFSTASEKHCSLVTVAERVSGKSQGNRKAWRTHGDIVETVKVGQCLGICLVLD